MDHVRTIIIDDERSACERLKKLLSSFKEIELLDYFTNSDMGLDFIHKKKPDLVFLDVELDRDISGFDIMNHLEGSLYKPQIILVTAHPHYSIKAIKYRVFDYLVKPVDIDELKETIARFVRNKSLESNIDLKAFSMLSEREMEILRHIMVGKSSRAIADLLYLSINTVHTHRRNILKKTGAGSVIDLLRMKSTSND